jgi:hypothetical protein
VLIDQYYGTSCKSTPEISITHAEVREAVNRGLTIIPVVRTQTWHEFAVWSKNPGQTLVFAHVKEPKVFEILNELYSTCNCQVYENLTGDDAMTEIAGALNAVITQRSTGAIQHIVLPDERKVISPPTPIAPAMGIPSFAEGQVLHADDLNALYQAIVNIASKHGLSIRPAVIWKTRDMLTPAQLNDLLDDVVRIYTHIGQSPPEWSFGRFQEGQVLFASQLNEVGERLGKL